MRTQDWMSGIHDFRALNDIIMPGSHDAGMSATAMGDQLSRGVGPLITHYKAGRTQNVDVEAQCNAGSRFFDIRMGDVPPGSGGNNISGVTQKRAQHAPGAGWMTYKSTTVFGEEERHIFQGVRRFLNANPSEVVLLRISKSACTILASLEADLNALLGDRLFKREEWCNLLDLPIGVMRGKAIVLIDDKGDQSQYINQKRGLHPFLNVTKNKQHRARALSGNVHGLASCGSYSEATSFHSMMGDLADYATGVRKVLNGNKWYESKAGQMAHWGAHVNGNCGCSNTPHLFMLYWTYTSKKPWNDVAKLTTEQNLEDQRGDKFEILTSQMEKNINDGFFDPNVNPGGDIYQKIQDLPMSTPNYWDARAAIIRKHLNSHTARERCMPNVVMYDFVNSKTSEEIIRLNHVDILEEATREQGYFGPVSQPIQGLNAIYQNLPGMDEFKR